MDILNIADQVMTLIAYTLFFLPFISKRFRKKMIRNFINDIIEEITKKKEINYQIKELDD
ncbi:hypothetical protein SBV1_gp29 [Sulfolobales Beppu virus 1]|nr:hypothetical protein SBV1_gp29 [Sulfolobales Beppu virus 1]